MARMSQRARCNSSWAYCLSCSVIALAIVPLGSHPINVVDVPMARRRSGCVFHGHLNHGWEVGAKRLLEGRPELGGGLDGDAASAETASDGGEVHRIGFAIALEQAAEAAAVVHPLEA